MNFFLICFGVLGCYAAIRTTRREGLRVLLIALLATCLLVIGVNRFMQPPAAPQEAAANRDFLARQILAVRVDACLLGVMRETPLSPVAYLLQMHNFMDKYRTAQSASAVGQASLGQTADLFMRSFGETGEELSPDEAGAVQGQGGPESLCHAFEKWVNNVAGYDPVAQRQIWNRLQAGKF